jgi:prophage maintenance system killer protein
MAFIALGQFLADNGVILTASPEDATEAMLGVARSQVSIEELAAWLRERTLVLFGRPPRDGS